MIEEVLKVPARVWKQTFLALLDYDDTASLPRIDAPTLLVWGEIDAVVSRDMQDHLARCIPAAKLVVYSGVGHTPRWEDPSRFGSDVAGFVTEQPPYARLTRFQVGVRSWPRNVGVCTSSTPR